MYLMFQSYNKQWTYYVFVATQEKGYKRTKNKAQWKALVRTKANVWSQNEENGEGQFLDPGNSLLDPLVCDKLSSGKKLS